MDLRRSGGGRVIGFRVAAERCDECLFSKDAIVDNARRREILSDCARRDAHFICHKFTLAAMRLERDPENVGQTCCRGFYDRNPAATNLMRIAGRLGMVEAVPLPMDAT
jgi:hypothetical protein